MDPYRDQVLVPLEKPPTNVYRYIVRDSNKCPVCIRTVPDTVWKMGEGSVPNRHYVFCHPLRRLIVSGFWWWKKRCPVDDTHYHLHCVDCNLYWIYPVEGDKKFKLEERFLVG